MQTKNTSNPQTTEGAIIRVTRGGRDLRDFAADLGISHTAVDQWEKDEMTLEPKRIKKWMKDEREWVKAMANALFAYRYAEFLFNVLNVE